MLGQMQDLVLDRSPFNARQVLQWQSEWFKEISCAVDRTAADDYRPNVAVLGLEKDFHCIVGLQRTTQNKKVCQAAGGNATDIVDSKAGSRSCGKHLEDLDVAHDRANGFEEKLCVLRFIPNVFRTTWAPIGSQAAVDQFFHLKSVAVQEQIRNRRPDHADVAVTEKLDVRRIIDINTATMNQGQRTTAYRPRILHRRMRHQSLKLQSRIGIDARVVAAESGSSFG